MDPIRQPSHWLRRYGDSHHYRWRRDPAAGTGTDAFCRPLGCTEFGFDGDGRYFEGRADLNCLLEVAIHSKLSPVDLRERILLAWTRVRCWHSLLRARTFFGKQRDDGDDDDEKRDDVWFLVDVTESVGRAIESAGDFLIFLEDHFGPRVDEGEFWMHCQNTARVIDPDAALAKCFVLPVDIDGKNILRFQLVLAHQIADGLSAWVWMRDFVQALNESEAVLRQGIADCIDPHHMQRHLPLPQEALYPQIPGSVARQRWFWAITRILRHVRKQLPTGFENPLKRPRPARVERLPPKYHPVLEYSRLPVLNTYPVYVDLPLAGMRRLQNLCRQAKASVGAGIYALAAVVMMEFEEELHPRAAAERKAFISGFPLNPRAFFNHHSDPDSMMLAFSDGIALPFLPASLPLHGRIRLLARQAQRQLATYQKRQKPEGHDATRQCLHSRGADLVLPNQYLLSLERAASILPPHLQTHLDAQGAYPPKRNPTMQTHGVSSVGNREHLLRSGIYDLDDPQRDFAADFRDLKSGVRAREGEFLLGILGSNRGLSACPSVDGTTLDPELVEKWRHRFVTILDEISDDGGEPKL
ncbi:Hypothetical predicted protein [Lecanosticta acicola]|uniref:Uncharacterized protein n=1 Tax=Lecanosticta acicola TaxID=111012 RepID=A0AAI8Z4S4_9PEZI|nr:Hypothetical predicted protein [Lecanosticta acicola]